MKKLVIVGAVLAICVAIGVFGSMKMKASADEKAFWTLVDTVEAKASANALDGSGDVRGMGQVSSSFADLDSAIERLPEPKKDSISQIVDGCRSEIGRANSARAKKKAPVDPKTVRAQRNQSVAEMCTKIKQLK